MKKLIAVLAAALILGAAPAAWAAATELWMGGDDNVTEANIYLVQVFGQDDVLSVSKFQSETGPALVVKSVKGNGVFRCPDGGERAEGGKLVRLYIGGRQQYDTVIIQMADINDFNKTHELSWEWEMYDCVVHVVAKPKN